MKKKFSVALSLLISFGTLADVCFLAIDCQTYPPGQSLGLFADIIQSRLNIPEGTANHPSKVQQNTAIKNENIQTQDPVKTSQKLPQPSTGTINDNDQSIDLESMIAINLKNQNVQAVLAKILPTWQIDIDDTLKGTKINVVIQTTRRQAVIDIARALSARVKFYKYTQPKPTLTLLKI